MPNLAGINQEIIVQSSTIMQTNRLLLRKAYS